jgi:hypothetical protein
MHRTGTARIPKEVCEAKNGKRPPIPQIYRSREQGGVSPAACMAGIGMPEVAEFLRDLLAGGVRRPSAQGGRWCCAAAADCACVRLDSGPKAADGVQVSRIPEAWLARFGTPLPLKQLGFSKVAQLAHAVPHVVRVVTKVRNRRLLAQRSPCKVRSLCRPALRHAVFIRALRA